MIANATEWTRTRYYTIESYPTQESLLDYRHSPYATANRIYKGSGDWKIYKRSDTAQGNNHFGFRPVRRQEGVDLKPTLAVAENFDCWTLKKQNGETTQTTVDGIWKLGYSLCVQDVGVNGSRAVSSGSGSLYFPSLTDQLCFIRFKAKNTHETYSRTVYLRGGTETYFSLPANMQEFKEYTLMTSPGADSYWLYIPDGGVIIDDLELWTVPRESK